MATLAEQQAFFELVKTLDEADRIALMIDLIYQNHISDVAITGFLKSHAIPPKTTYVQVDGEGGTHIVAMTADDAVSLKEYIEDAENEDADDFPVDANLILTQASHSLPIVGIVCTDGVGWGWTDVES